MTAETENKLKTSITVVEQNEGEKAQQEGAFSLPYEKFDRRAATVIIQ